MKRTESDQSEREREREAVNTQVVKKDKKCQHTSEGISNSRRCSRRSQLSFTDVS